MKSNETQESSPLYQILAMLTTQTLSVMTAQLQEDVPATKQTIEYISDIVTEREQVMDYIAKLTVMRGDEPFSAQDIRVEANFKTFMDVFPKETKDDEKE